MKKSIKNSLPKGYTAKNITTEVVDGAIILSYEVEQAYKRGDFLMTCHGTLFIFSGEYDKNGNLDILALYHNNTGFLIRKLSGLYAAPNNVIPITDEKKQLLINKMNEAGYELSEDNEIVPYRWKPNHDDWYYYILSTGKVEYTQNNTNYDMERIEFENCFKTKEEAEPKAKEFKSMLKK